MNIEDELCNLLNNKLKIIDKETHELIIHDFTILTNYYFEIMKNEENFNFCIDPSPHLDIYINNKTIKDMYNYLSDDFTGYKLLYKMIKDKYKIIPEENIISSLLDYYFEFLLN
jgi:hypothetical protein